MAKDFLLSDLPDLPGGTAVGELPDLPLENTAPGNIVLHRQTNEDVQSLLKPRRLRRSVLQGPQGLVHEDLAVPESVDAGTTSPSTVSALRQFLQAAGKVGPEDLPLRGNQNADAPPGLQQALAGGVDLRQVPSGTSLEGTDDSQNGPQDGSPGPAGSTAERDRIADKWAALHPDGVPPPMPDWFVQGELTRGQDNSGVHPAGFPYDHPTMGKPEPYAAAKSYAAAVPAGLERAGLGIGKGATGLAAALGVPGADQAALQLADFARRRQQAWEPTLGAGRGLDLGGVPVLPGAETVASGTANVAGLAPALIPGVGAPLIAGQMAGEGYTGAREAGMDPGQARLVAALGGATGLVAPLAGGAAKPVEGLVQRALLDAGVPDFVAQRAAAGAGGAAHDALVGTGLGVGGAATTGTYDSDAGAQELSGALGQGGDLGLLGLAMGAGKTPGRFQPGAGYSAGELRSPKPEFAGVQVDSQAAQLPEQHAPDQAAPAVPGARPLSGADQSQLAQTSKDQFSPMLDAADQEVYDERKAAAKKAAYDSPSFADVAAETDPDRVASLYPDWMEPKTEAGPGEAEPNADTKQVDLSDKPTVAIAAADTLPDLPPVRRENVSPDMADTATKIEPTIEDGQKRGEVDLNVRPQMRQGTTAVDVPIKAGEPGKVAEPLPRPIDVLSSDGQKGWDHLVSSMTDAEKLKYADEIREVGTLPGDTPGNPESSIGALAMMVNGRREKALRDQKKQFSESLSQPKEPAHVPEVPAAVRPEEAQANVPQPGRQEEVGGAAQSGERPPGADVAKSFKPGKAVRDHDILDEIAAQGGLGRTPKDRSDANRQEWEGRPRLPASHEAVIGGGEAKPDDMASRLKDAGYGDGAPRTMWELIDKASKSRMAVSRDLASDRPGPGYTTQERAAIDDSHPSQEDASFDFGEKPPAEPPAKPGQQEMPLPETKDQLPGGRINKRPELANPGESGAERDSITAARNEMEPLETRGHEELIAKAKKRASEDLPGLHRELTQKLADGKVLDDRETMEARETISRLYRTGDAKAAQELATAYTASGTELARAMSARQSNTPEGRGQAALSGAMAHGSRDAKELEDLRNQVRDLQAQAAKVGTPNGIRRKIQSAKTAAKKEFLDLGKQLHKAITGTSTTRTGLTDIATLASKMLVQGIKHMGLSAADTIIAITDQVRAFRHDERLHKALDDAYAKLRESDPSLPAIGSVAELVAADSEAKAEKRAAATIKRYEGLEAYYKKEAAEIAAMTPEQRQRYVQGEAAKSELPPEVRETIEQHKANLRELRDEIDRLTADTDKQIADEKVRIEQLLASREAENQKLAAMSPTDRAAYLKRQFDAGKKPEAIEKLRADSKSYLKMLAERKAELIKGAASKLPEVKSIQEQMAVEQRRIDNQVAGWQARRDRLANMSVEERRKAREDRQPDPIIRAMRDQAQRDHADLRKELRDLQNPPDIKVDSPELRAIQRRLETVNRRIDEIQQKGLANFEKVIKPHLKRNGFDLDDEKQEWRNSKEGLEAFNHALVAARGDWTDVYKFWVTASLHGLAAPFKKIAADPLSIGLDKLLLRPLEALANKFPGGVANGASFTEVGMTLRAMLPSILKGAEAFGPAYREQGYKDSRLATQDYAHYPTVNGAFGNAVSHLSTLRFVKALDVMAKTISTTADVGGFAHRTAVDATGERLTGENYENHQKSELANPDSKSWAMARERAAKDTFTDPVRGLQWLNRIKNSQPETAAGKALKVTAITLAPFTTIPGNILKHGVFNAVPLVSDALTVIRALARRHDGDYDRNAFNRDVAKAAARWMGYAVLSAANRSTGFLTGHDDKDHPNSLNLFGHHFSFAHLGPISYLLSSVADMSTAKPGQQMASLWEGISHRLTDESALRALGDLNEARKAQDGWLKFASRTAGSTIVPAVIRQIFGAYNEVANGERARKTVYQPGEQAKGNPVQRMLTYMLENADVPGFTAKPWRNPDGSLMTPEHFGFKPADFMWRLISPLRMGKGMPNAKPSSLPVAAPAPPPAKVRSPRQGVAVK